MTEQLGLFDLEPPPPPLEPQLGQLLTGKTPWGQPARGQYVGLSPTGLLKLQTTGDRIVLVEPHTAAIATVERESSLRFTFTVEEIAPNTQRITTEHDDVLYLDATVHHAYPGQIVYPDSANAEGCYLQLCCDRHDKSRAKYHEVGAAVYLRIMNRLLLNPDLPADFKRHETARLNDLRTTALQAIAECTANFHREETNGD